MSFPLVNLFVRAPHFVGIPRGPVVFLAGPILGAPDWQAEAAAAILPHAHVASPRAEAVTGALPDDAFARQVEWESTHLLKASAWGVILFWLPRAVVDVPGRAYAQTSRFELAEWVTRRRFDRHTRLVLGVEPGFPGERYIRHRLAQDTSLAVHTTLDATVAAAIAAIDPHLQP